MTNSLIARLAAISDRRPHDDDTLHAYIEAVLGYHIPRVAVCPGHQAPFDIIADAFFGRAQRQLVLAGRGTGKTHGASIQNLLKSKFWPGTGTGHYAAVEAQSTWGLSYLKEMLQPAYLKKDIKSDLADYIEWRNGSWVRVGTGRTTAGVTAYHPNRLVIDEVDQWDAQAYETAQYMLSGSPAHPPELQVASTAYTSHGLITPLLAQKERRGFVTYRFCLFEAIRRCETCRGKSCPLYAWENPRTGKYERLCQDRALRSDGFIRYEDAVDEFLRTDSATYLVQKLLEAPERSALIYPTFDPVKHVGSVPEHIVHNAPVGIGVDWGFDHPEVFSVWAQTGDGRYWGIEEIGRRFLSPSEELEIATTLSEKYARATGRSGTKAFPTFFCGKDQPQSIRSFAEHGFIVVGNEPRLRDDGHKEVRRLLDPNKGPLMTVGANMPMTAHELATMHRDEHGREVLKDNDFGDAVRHVLATAALMGGIQAGGGFVR